MSTLSTAGTTVLCTAFEGGIGYWSRAYDVEYRGDFPDGEWEYDSMTLVEFEEILQDYPREGGILEQLFAPYTEMDKAYESGELGLNHAEYVHTITAKEIDDFLGNLMNLDPDTVKVLGRSRSLEVIQALEEDPELPDLDAEACDVIVQAIALGELRYG